MDLQSAIKGYTSFIQRWPKSVIFVILILTFLFSIPLANIKVDSSAKLYTPEFLQAPYDRLSSRITIPYDFHTIFVLGKGNVSVFSLESMNEQSRLVDTLHRDFDVDTFSAVDILNKEIGQRYNKTIEDVRDDKALSQIVYEVFSSSPQDFRIAAQSMLSEGYDFSPLEKQYYLTQFLPIISLFPIQSGDLPFTQFMSIDVQLKNRNLSDSEREKLSVDIRSVVDEMNFTYIRPVSFSFYVLSYDVGQKIGSSTELLGILTFISMSALIYLGFRRAYYIFVPLFVTGVALVWSFGTAVLLGLVITPLHTFVIALVVALSIEGPVHIIKRYQEERESCKPDIAINQTMSTIFVALFLVSFTTVASFLISYLLPSSPSLNSFEAVVCIGITYAFILECLLVPAFLTLKEYPAATSDSRDTVRKMSDWIFGISYSYFWIIVALLSVLFLLSLYNLNKIETDVSGDMFVPEGVPSKEAIRIRDTYGQEYRPQYVMIEGNVTQPKIIHALDRLEENLQDNEMYERINDRVKFESINTLLNEMNHSVNDTTDLRLVYDGIYGNDSIADPITKSTFSEKAKSMVLKGPDGYDTILAFVWTQYQKSSYVEEAYDEMMADIKDSGLNDINNTTITLSGTSFMGTRTELYVRQMQIVSSVLMFIFTFLFIFVTYRKLVLSIIISLPIFLVSFFTFGLMPVLGMPLTWLNATVVSILIGLGVDYSIYLGERYQEELKKGKNRVEAARISLEQTGDGVWMACFTTITGFIIVSFSFLPMAKSFGILSAISILLVFLVTIFLVPPLLIRFVKD